MLLGWPFSTSGTHFKPEVGFFNLPEVEIFGTGFTSILDRQCNLTLLIYIMYISFLTGEDTSKCFIYNNVMLTFLIKSPSGSHDSTIE